MYEIVIDGLQSLLSTNRSHQSDNNVSCTHKYIELWGDRFMCTDCSPAKEITATEFPEKFEYETLLKNILGEHNVSGESVNRGIKIGFLVELCNTFNLRNLSTRQVRRNIVVPMTSSTRCRFVDLPTLRGTEIVGQATTFISHSWFATFGDLVDAISEGADYERIVWIDIFAVRQWPCSKSDLDFERVIRRCNSLLVVIPFCREILGRECQQLGLSPMTRQQIPFFRTWCLYELYFAATTHGVAIVIKLGKPPAAFNLRYITHNPSERMLTILSHIIDIDSASATNPSDKADLFRRVNSNFEGGTRGLNTKVQSILLSSAFIYDSSDAILHCAACGDIAAKESVIASPSTYIHFIAASGYVNLLQETLSRWFGIVDVVNLGHRNLGTPLMAAIRFGNLPCALILLENGADVTLRIDGSWGGRNALQIARDYGYELEILEFVQLLENT